MKEVFKYQERGWYDKIKKSEKPKLGDFWWLWVGEPQEEGYDVDSSKFPLSNLPKVIELVGFDGLRKVVGDDSSPGASKIASSQLTVVPSTTWNLHSTNQNFAQLETERLSIPPVLQNKELVAQCGKQ